MILILQPKKKDKGTGIGLAVVHGIVKSHGGNIELQSTKNEGTSFIIYFPCLMEDRKDAQKDSMAPTPCGSEKILVVDDEEAIARMVRQMLERLGYTVTVRTSSAEAFQLFKDDPYRFDLVITDNDHAQNDRRSAFNGNQEDQNRYPYHNMHWFQRENG